MIRAALPARVHADVVTTPPRSRREKRCDALMAWASVWAVPVVLIALFALRFVGA